MAKLQEYELEEMFKNFIDETTIPISIWGMEYSTSYILQEVDPIAYRVGFNDWLDSLDDCDDCEKNPIECDCEAE